MLRFAATVVLLTCASSASARPEAAVQERTPNDARNATIVVSAGAGAVAGAALGVGAGFALVYGTNDNGCYFGGCDAPLLSAVGFAVGFGVVGSLAGTVIGGIVGARLTE